MPHAQSTYHRLHQGQNGLPENGEGLRKIASQYENLSSVVTVAAAAPIRENEVIK